MVSVALFFDVLAVIRLRSLNLTQTQPLRMTGPRRTTRRSRSLMHQTLRVATSNTGQTSRLTVS